jgi:hypothetical protein
MFVCDKVLFVTAVAAVVGLFAPNPDAVLFLKPLDDVPLAFYIDWFYPMPPLST